jgi:hypothetical protein
MGIQAERWAAPKPAHLAMCGPVDPACIAAPQGDRLGPPAFSAARPGEGHQSPWIP